MTLEKLAQIHLIKGTGGGDPKNGLCIMEMVSYFAGSDVVTDTPECACRALTRYAMGLNDSAPSQEMRDELKLLLPLLTGSRDDDAIPARVRHLVLETAHRLIAPLFDRRWPKHAKAIREAMTYEALSVACGDARGGAYATAAHAADISTYAAAFAYAAYAGAYAARAAAAAAASYVDNAAAAAAAYAAAAATVAADAAAYAVDTLAAYAAVAGGAEKRRAWIIARDILVEAIKLGKHGGLDMDAAETVARAEQLLAYVRA